MSIFLSQVPFTVFFGGILMDGSLYLAMFTAVMDTVSVSSLLNYVFIVVEQLKLFVISEQSNMYSIFVTVPKFFCHVGKNKFKSLWWLR